MQERPSWIHLDKVQNVIYINLNSDDGKIVKLAPGADPELVDNELGLVSSRTVRPFRYIPNAGEAEGFLALQTLLMDTAPLPLSQRYFLLCWAISAFLMPFFDDRFLLQLFGSAGSGKSQVAARLLTLFCGEVHWGNGTAVAGMRIAENNPLVVLDNVETRNLHLGTSDFLLFMANGAHKMKEKARSGPELMFHKLNSLCMVTSIEPFPEELPELTNRTINLTTSRTLRQHDYRAEIARKSIREDRDLMLSAIFKLIGKRVLPCYLDDQFPHEFWWDYVFRMYDGRNKRHLYSMIIILNAVLEHLPLDGRETLPIGEQMEIIVNDWVTILEAEAI